MYEEFMGLSQRPFVASPDVNMYVRTEVHEKALRQLMFGMNANRGISLLTGVEGTGKSILARKLIQNLEKATIPLYFPNSHFATRRDFYQTILFELRQPFAGLGLQELRLQLTSVMRQMAPRHRPILLVIDEAHLLNDRILEEVRNCLNFVVEGDSVFRTLLVGHSELEERLAHPDLSAVNNRIGAQAMLPNLSRAQSVQYISQRLQLAHGKPETIFNTDAIFAIAEAADGSPRAINQLCDHALMLAMARGIRPVDLETVLDSLEELQTLPLHWRTPSVQNLAGSEGTSSPVRSDKPAYEKFQTQSSPQAGASIEVGSAWDEEPEETSSVIEIGMEDTSHSSVFAEEDLLEEVLEEHLDAEFDLEDEFNLEDEEIDPVLDARLTKLSDREIQQDALAEVCLLNDVLNVQLKDEPEVTAAERRIIASSSPRKPNSETPTSAGVQPSSEVIMDRYALLDAGLIERVREWENSSQSTEPALATPNKINNETEEDVYPLLEEDRDPNTISAEGRQEVHLGSISLNQNLTSESEINSNALEQLREKLPTGHLSFKFNRPSKSA
ncbi:MAG: AAA family ATPase [Planctomycetaceae bacterium]|nr:AAA family ATPase [Planctomycetaceae bacterium]